MTDDISASAFSPEGPNPCPTTDTVGGAPPRPPIPLPDNGPAVRRRADAFTVATWVAWAVFGLVTALAVAVAAGDPTGLPALHGDGLLLVLFLATIVVGSSLRNDDAVTRMSGTTRAGGASRTVDVGATAALALSVTTGLGHAGWGSPWIALGVSAVGLVVGGILASRSVTPAGWSPVWWHAAPRLVTVVVLSAILAGVGATHPFRAAVGAVPPQVGALALLTVVYAVLILEAPLRAEATRPARGTRRTVHAAALAESITLGIVPASTAVLVAVAQPLLGLPALPLILLPLMFNQFAIRRRDEMREHARQSVVALSHLPEARGMVRPGHAARVADLSTRIGREIGLGRRELAEIERAALLHDLGQVRLERPVPSGATVLAAPADQEGIAADGAAIARATGVLDVEADLIEAQALPYRLHVSHRRPQPVASRVIRVANAYDDLLTGRSAGLPLADPDAALERLYLGLGHEYDPRVVGVLDTLVHGVSGAGGGPGPERRT